LKKNFGVPDHVRYGGEAWKGNDMSMGKASLGTWTSACLMIASIIVLGGCTPRVEVAPSDKPITINLNVKIDHEIRVKVDQELSAVLAEKNGLF
jgi:hypothetical protein